MSHRRLKSQRQGHAWVAGCTCGWSSPAGGASSVANAWQAHAPASELDRSPPVVVLREMRVYVHCDDASCGWAGRRGPYEVPGWQRAVTRATRRPCPNCGSVVAEGKEPACAD